VGIGFRPRQWLTQNAVKVAPKHRARILRSRLNPNRHRWLTGGGWNDIGTLQLEFLVTQGLAPAHRLLDVGCGALRGGVHFVRYLDRGHYGGMDANGAFLKAGRGELRLAGLDDKGAVLLHDDAFRFSRFGHPFDYALAVSVFTHLPFNAIMRCLSEMEQALAPGGKFYATYFRNTGRRLRHDDMATTYHVVHLDRDPYYYDPDLFVWAVEGSDLTVTVHGDWGHPRDQEMLIFTKRAPAG
jgi:cyclopropane fatty-acyl-phospholipid synthase-like methyltransferase